MKPSSLHHQNPGPPVADMESLGNFLYIGDCPLSLYSFGISRALEKWEKKRREERPWLC